MSTDPRLPRETHARLEERLRAAAAAFSYPPTPDLAARERIRRAGGAAAPRRASRLALGLALVVLLLAAAMLVTPVRARVLDWIRVGAVRIFFTQPSPLVTPAPEGSSTPAATATFVPSILDIGGETTLEAARQQVRFDLQAPTYPPDLGSPDHVFAQELGGPVVVLVWMDPDHPDEVRMSLSQTSSDRMAFEKYTERSVQNVTVGGQPGLWIEGEYLLLTRAGEATLTRLITQGHTLVWSTGEMTYRLETDASLEEALRTAESIRPLP